MPISTGMCTKLPVNALEKHFKWIVRYKLGEIETLALPTAILATKSQLILLILGFIRLTSSGPKETSFII